MSVTLKIFQEYGKDELGVAAYDYVQNGNLIQFIYKTNLAKSII